MIDCMLSLYPAIQEFSQLPENEEICSLLVKNSEITVLNDICLYLKTFHVIQEIVSSKKTPTLAVVLPLYERLIPNLKTLKIVLPQLSHMIDSSLGKIYEYVDKARSTHMYAFALFINPTSKLTWIEGQWNAEDISNAKTAILDVMTKHRTSIRHEKIRTKTPRRVTVDIGGSDAARALQSGFDYLNQFTESLQTLSRTSSASLSLTSSNGSLSEIPEELEQVIDASLGEEDCEIQAIAEDCQLAEAELRSWVSDGILKSSIDLIRFWDDISDAQLSLEPGDDGALAEVQEHVKLDMGFSSMTSNETSTNFDFSALSSKNATLKGRKRFGVDLEIRPGDNGSSMELVINALGAEEQLQSEVLAISVLVSDYPKSHSYSSYSLSFTNTPLVEGADQEERRMGGEQENGKGGSGGVGVGGRLPHDPLQQVNGTGGEQELNLPLTVFSYLVFMLVADYEALKPYVCDSMVCSYQYYSFGLGLSLEHEIIHNSSTSNLLVSLTYSSAAEGILDKPLPIGIGLCVNPVDPKKIVRPPTTHRVVPVLNEVVAAATADGLVDFDELSTGKRRVAITVLIDSLPSIDDMKKHLDRKVRSGKSKPTLKEMNVQILPAAWLVLRWIIGSCLVDLEEITSGEEHIKHIETPPGINTASVRATPGM
ncbi:hypothetical protein D9758_014527 [Tetrapyrgos nigripes]|uniref:Uncharacterized protein n=1 Tax=Tetrapyrgos nigripes TaxID=182062 RepID=A0A8H5CTV6_9AGAR|nr:hypothetical protein D9758_014527 [Tetrapyrgos nigripes]